jgi:hypothetical protein
MFNSNNLLFIKCVFPVWLLQLKPKCVAIHYVVRDSFCDTVMISEHIALNS